MSRSVELVELLRTACARWGFDLVHPFQVGWYNGSVDAELRLDDFGSRENLGVLIGNTRALWPAWRAALASDPELGASKDPLDLYTVRALQQVLTGIAEQVSVRFGHARGARRVAMQRLAHASGLAYLTETHMSVHATYGPWIALRAVLSVAIPGPPGPAPALAHPCGSCALGCLPAFERALGTLDGAPNEAHLRATWQLWVACRDACPVGREHRYSEAQIRYHYLRQLDSDPHPTAAPTPVRAKR